MTDLTEVYDQLAAVVWRDGMPDSAHGVHSRNRGYHRHCPICNGDLMRVLEAAAQLFEQQQPDDLDAFIEKQRAADPKFRAAYDRLRGSGG
jgi:hypothetical protein